jgi:putative ABC transport system substrate-binding protein
LITQNHVLSSKRVDLLKETIPTLSRLALITPGGPRGIAAMEAVGTTASLLGVEVQSFPVRSVDDLESAFDAASQYGEAALVSNGPPLNIDIEWVVELASQKHLPAMYEIRRFADMGGLMAYGPNLPASARRAATYVHKILKGTSPADLPVEGPTTFDFIVNLKTAKALGFTIPASVHFQASEIIE